MKDSQCFQVPVGWENSVKPCIHAGSHWMYLEADIFFYLFFRVYFNTGKINTIREAWFTKQPNMMEFYSICLRNAQMLVFLTGD